MDHRMLPLQEGELARLKPELTVWKLLAFVAGFAVLFAWFRLIFAEPYLSEVRAFAAVLLFVGFAGGASSAGPGRRIRGALRGGLYSGVSFMVLVTLFVLFCLLLESAYSE